MTLKSKHKKRPSAKLGQDREESAWSVATKKIP